MVRYAINIYFFLLSFFYNILHIPTIKPDVKYTIPCSGRNRKGPLVINVIHVYILNSEIPITLRRCIRHG